MTCTMYGPYSDLTRLNQEVDQFLTGLFGGPAPHYRIGQFYTGQDDSGYYLEAAVPGLDPASLQVRVEDRILTLTGKRPSDTREVRWHLRERNRGEFSHQLRIPVNVDVQGITADYTNGLLTVTLPKAESAKPRQIEVKVS